MWVGVWGGRRVWRGCLGEQVGESGGDGFAPRGIVAAGVGIVGIMIEAGVATLEAADAGQAGAVDADRGGPAARGIGNHVPAEQAEHGVDLVVVEFLGPKSGRGSLRERVCTYG